MNEPIASSLEIEGNAIALRLRPGNAPGLFWLGGFRSDMSGTKAEALDRWAAGNDRACVRFDYSGHGESGGDYREGTISRWLGEALTVLRKYADGPQILVGSSMGGWIALRIAQELARSGESGMLAGMVLLAPAPDFTAELIEPALTEAQRRSLEERGFFEEPSAYSDEPNVYTRRLLEDGRQNLVLTGRIETHCPVHVLHGQADPDVPHQLSLRLVEHLPADDVILTLIRDGDHRLSRPQDIELLLGAVARMVMRFDGQDS